MEFEGCKFKYENDKLYKLFKTSNQHGRKGEWVCCNDLVSNDKGYIRVRVNNKKYALYRLIYKLHNPNWNIYDNTDNNFIDHIDKNPHNNKIENLRIITKQQNAFNTNAKGYYFNKQYNKYKAQIGITIEGKRKSIFLGSYDTEEEAHNKYIEAKKLYHII